MSATAIRVWTIRRKANIGIFQRRGAAPLPSAAPWFNRFTCAAWPERGAPPWSLPGDEARPFFKQALDAGINFFDTANVYSDGTSEEIVGRALRDMARREDVVIATKVHGRMRPGPNGAGLSRKAILHEIEASLTRLSIQRYPGVAYDRPCYERDKKKH